MSRYIKERIVEEYAERFREVADVAAVNTEGIDANQMVALRATLRERGLDTMRVQNRLCRLAIREGPLAGAESLFDGPTTLVWGAESIVDIAKTLQEQAKELPALEIRGGFSQGAVLTSEQIEDLSQLPGREELIGQIVARATGQASRLVSLATAPASALLAQIREIEKQAPAAEEAPAEETPAAEAAEEKPAEEAPAQEAAEAPAEEAGSDESPSDEAPADEAKDEAPAEEAQRDEEARPEEAAADEPEQTEGPAAPEAAEESETT
jgi:large subunit ribosomal protein L10